MPHTRGGIDYDFLLPLIGVADSGSDTELTDNAKDMEKDMFQNAWIHIFKITKGVEYIRNINSNTSNKLTFNSIAPAKVEGGDIYYIER